MSDDPPIRFRGSSDPRPYLEEPNQPIAGGLIHPDVPTAPPTQRRALLWTLVSIIAVFTLSLGTLGFAIVTNEPDAPMAEEQLDPSTPPPPPFPADTPAVAAGAAPCTVVNVLSSFENAEMVERLAKGYNDMPRDINGSCVTVVASKDKSGNAATRAASGFAGTAPEQRPTVWLPDSTSWLSVANANGATGVPTAGTGVASSAIVLAMPAPLAFAIGWYNEPPTWEKVFEAADHPDIWSALGHPEWGAFKLGKTSPLVATSGEAALLASFGASGSGFGATTVADYSDPEIIASVTRNELATSHYMATPEHFLWHARQAEDSGGASADFLSAVIVDEKSVWDYNRGMTSNDGVTRTKGHPPRDELVAIYPKDGVYVADNPAAVLTGEWIDPQETAAAADFIRFAGTAEGQKIVTDSGYRDLHGRLAPAVQDIGILPRRIPQPINLPGQDVVAGLQHAFPEVRKRASVLFLIDVSGSMDEQIPNGQTKLEAAKSAIVAALDHFTPGDSVGLAAFSSAGGAEISPGLVSPVADIGTNRDALLTGVQGLTPLTFTPLYAAVDQFTAQHAAHHDPTRINAVVLLSDGANETAEPTIDEAGLLANLSSLHHSSPVLVFTLAYGANADIDTLRAISSTTGAHFYDATDPTKVTAILGDLVTSF